VTVAGNGTLQPRHEDEEETPESSSGITSLPTEKGFSTMNEYEQQPNESPTDSQSLGATPASALHTVLEYVIKNRQDFRIWLNASLAREGKKLILTQDEIDEGLESLDDILHIAMAAPRGRRALAVPPAVLDAILAEVAKMEGEIINIDTNEVKRIDPDEGTGMYL
jgi:hypothetical protein